MSVRSLKKKFSPQNSWKPGNHSKNATMDFNEITERVLRTICFAQLRGKMWKEDAQEARR